MPTPRAHGGAALVNIPLTVPGFRGLNRQVASSTLTPEWATRLENAVLDDSGRVAARQGWAKITTTPASADDFVTLFEYVQTDGSHEIIGTTATKIYRSVNNGTTWVDITGTAVFTDGNWHFVNFNDNVYGFQEGLAPIEYTGTSFAPLTDVNAPQGGVALSAFGRLWATEDDGTTVKYSALLDGTDWTTASDAGQIGVLNVWGRADRITGLAAFNGALVIFGKWNILFYTDNQGSAIGIDPLQISLVDTIYGTGCLTQKSIQGVNNDLWFLGPQGLMSIGRLIQEKSNPIDNLSKHVQDFLGRAVNAAELASIRSTFYAKERLYILSLPNGPTGSQAVVFDTRGLMEDGSARCSGIWNGMVPTDMVATNNDDLIIALAGKAGEVGLYSGYLDDTEPYVFKYESGWLDLDQGTHLKFLKRLNGVFFIDRAATVDFRWAFDFEDTFQTSSLTFSDFGQSAEFGISEFGIAEFSGGVNLRRGRVPANRNGEYIKVGVQVNITGSEFSLQELELFARIGRLA